MRGYLNVTEAVWDHLKRERNKRQDKSKVWEVVEKKLVQLPDKKTKGEFPQKGSRCM